MILAILAEAAPGPWTFGWTAVAGIATAVLAGFTWWLAFSTRKLATETDEDIQANWRPILAPTGMIDVFVRTDAAEELFRVRIVFALSNSGKGPAVNANVHGLGSRSVSGVTWADSTASLIPSTEYEVIEAEGTVPIGHPPRWDSPQRYMFVVTYEDVARNRHRSSFAFAIPGLEPERLLLRGGASEGHQTGPVIVQDIEVETLGERAPRRGLPR